MGKIEEGETADKREMLPCPPCPPFPYCLVPTPHFLPTKLKQRDRVLDALLNLRLFRRL